MTLSDSLLGAERLLVRGLNWIGDAVMSLPTLRNVRDSVPGAYITVFAPGWSAGLYRACPAVDEVIETPPKGLLSEFGLSRRISGGKYDGALILPNSFRSALGPALAGVPNRWGYRTDRRSMLLSRAVRLPERAKQEHTVLYYRELLEAAGIAWTGERFDIELSEETRSRAEEIVRQRGAQPDSKRIGISPGAAWGPSKRWPADRFAEAARQLIESAGSEALVFGSPADAELAGGIAGTAGAGAVDLSGAFEELAHLAATIASCGVLITNDSGPMHLAAALGVPVVAIFGPTDEIKTGPWDSGGGSAVIARAPHCRPCYNPECTEPGHPCMEEIEVEEVVAAARGLLERKEQEVDE